MGNCIPKSLRLSSTQKNEILLRYKRIQDILLLNNDELWLLYTIFIKINQNSTGFITEEELFSYLDMDGGLFAHRIFKMFKDQYDGGISFQAFLIICWSICTRDKNNLINFSFQIYDILGRGELGLADIRLLLSEVFGTNFENHKAGKEIYHSLVRFDYQNQPLEAHISPKLFYTISQNHPLLLFPAFELQQKLINKTLKHKWEDVTERRDKAIKLKKFDIMKVISLANDHKQRRGSMVPISDRHMLNILDFGFNDNDNNSNSPYKTNQNNLNLPPGLRTSNKIIPEPDYTTSTGLAYAIDNNAHPLSPSNNDNHDNKPVGGPSSRRISVTQLQTNNDTNDENMNSYQPPKQRRASIEGQQPKQRRASLVNGKSPGRRNSLKPMDQTALLLSSEANTEEPKDDQEPLFAPRGRRRQSISITNPTSPLSNETNDISPSLISTSALLQENKRVGIPMMIATAADENQSNNQDISINEPLLAPRGEHRRGSSHLPGSINNDNSDNNNILSKPKERRASITKPIPGQRRGSNDAYVQAQRRVSLVT